MKEEYELRLAKNPNYSLRSFAHTLKMNIGTVSALLSGKRPVSQKTVESVCDHLGISPLKRQKLLELVRKQRAEVHPALLKKMSLHEGIDTERVRLDHEIFKAVSQWHHWAILQLLRLDNYRSSPDHARPRWFAARLGLNEMQVKLSLERLLELGLLEIKNGFYCRTKQKFTTRDHRVTTPALRLWQKGLREKAIESLENDSIEKRSMTSMTMAIDPAKLNEARILIEEFQEKLCEFMECEKKEKVYQLTVSLFPLEKSEDL